ncbi:MAG: zf-HC2 domain-containing protein [candidate division WOR-3 bacterium]
MRKHQKYEELIQGYLDNELTEKEKKELETHLKICNLCKGKIRERKKLLRIFQSQIEEVQCPSGLIDIILKNTIKKESLQGVRPILRWNYIVLSAAAIFILFFTVFYLRYKPTTSLAETQKIQEKSQEEIKTKESIPKSEIKEIVKKETKINIMNEPLETPSSEEIHFVFPEEGAVVGENFEIVLVLEKPVERIEIKIDGEEIKNYKIISNVLYLDKEFLPPLEEGLHYLSIKTLEEKAITFYKEG